MEAEPLTELQPKPFYFRLDHWKGNKTLMHRIQSISQLPLVLLSAGVTVSESSSQSPCPPHHLTVSRVACPPGTFFLYVIWIRMKRGIIKHHASLLPRRKQLDSITKPLISHLRHHQLSVKRREASMMLFVLHNHQSQHVWDPPQPITPTTEFYFPSCDWWRRDSLLDRGSLKAPAEIEKWDPILFPAITASLSLPHSPGHRGHTSRPTGEIY